MNNYVSNANTTKWMHIIILNGFSETTKLVKRKKLNLSHHNLKSISSTDGIMYFEWIPHLFIDVFKNIYRTDEMKMKGLQNLATATIILRMHFCDVIGYPDTLDYPDTQKLYFHFWSGNEKIELIEFFSHLKKIRTFLFWTMKILLFKTIF